MTLKILFEFCILKKMHITHKKFKKPRLHKIKKKKTWLKYCGTVLA